MWRCGPTEVGPRACQFCPSERLMRNVYDGYVAGIHEQVLIKFVTINGQTQLAVLSVQ